MRKLTSNIGESTESSAEIGKVQDEPTAEESEVQSDDDENVDPADFGIDSADGESEDQNEAASTEDPEKLIAKQKLEKETERPIKESLRNYCKAYR